MEKSEQARIIRDSFKNSSWKLDEDNYDLLVKELGKLDTWFSVFCRDFLFKVSGKVCIKKPKINDALSYLSFFINGDGKY